MGNWACFLFSFTAVAATAVFSYYLGPIYALSVYVVWVGVGCYSEYVELA